MIKKISGLIKKIENSTLPIKYYILSFFFIMTTRNFLEIFSAHYRISYIFFLHYYLSYICLAITVILLFYLATKEDIKKISKVILLFFSILILPPIVDLIISFGKGAGIMYLIPGKDINLLHLFITYFGPIKKAGITIGMRTEIGLAIIGSFIYFLVKTKKKIRSLFFSFLFYTTIFFYCAMPFVIIPILKLFKIDDPVLFFNAGRGTELITYVFAFLIFIFALLIFYINNKKYFLAILKDLRFCRLLHYILLVILGFLVGKHSQIDWTYNLITPELTFSFLFALVSIIFAWGFSVITNNIADQDIDKISNSNRPLIKGVIPLDIYKKISWGFFSASLAYSYLVNFKIFYLVLTYIGLFYLYSIPPLRLKRITYFSKIVPALNSVIMLLVGYLFVYSSLGIFPRSIVLYFLIFITAAMNFIDIKDYKGDKHAGIKTLPTIMGLKRSKILIGLFFVAAYIAAYFLFSLSSYFLYLFILLGVIQFLLINKKRYSEMPIFIVYLLTLLLFIIIIK